MLIFLKDQPIIIKIARNAKNKVTVLIILIMFCILFMGFSFKAMNLREKARKAEDSEKAIEYYLESLEIEPDHAETLKTVGRMLWEKGNYIKAEQLLKRAVEIDDDYALAWNNLGWVYNRTEQYDKMLDAFKKAAQCESFFEVDWAWNQVGLGIAYYNTGDLSKAEQHLVRALKNISRGKSAKNAKTEAFLWLGCVYNKQGDEKTANSYFEKYIDRHNKTHVANRNIGRALYNDSYYELSEKYLKKSVEINSRFSMGWNNLGWLYGRTERYAEMRDAFNTFLRLFSNILIYKYLLAI